MSDLSDPKFKEYFTPRILTLWSAKSIYPTDRRIIKTVDFLRAWRHLYFGTRKRSCVKIGELSPAFPLLPPVQAVAGISPKHAAEPASSLQGASPCRAPPAWGLTPVFPCPRCHSMAMPCPSAWQPHCCPFEPHSLWNASQEQIAYPRPQDSFASDLPVVPTSCNALQGIPQLHMAAVWEKSSIWLNGCIKWQRFMDSGSYPVCYGDLELGQNQKPLIAHTQI